MATKLTLSLDEKVIREAKQVAHKRGESLSKMVENYFISLTGKRKNASIVERMERRLKPHLDETRISADADYKKMLRDWKYGDYLKQKTK